MNLLRVGHSRRFNRFYAYPKVPVDRLESFYRIIQATSRDRAGQKPFSEGIKIRLYDYWSGRERCPDQDIFYRIDGLLFLGISGPGSGPSGRSPIPNLMLACKLETHSNTEFSSNLNKISSKYICSL